MNDLFSYNYYIVKRIYMFIEICYNLIKNIVINIVIFSFFNVLEKEI